MSNQLELLIVEDNVAEAIYAQTEAARLGLRNFVVAQDLGQAFEMLERDPKYLVSDLFFPAGNIDVQLYVNRFLPAYEAFGNQRFSTKQRNTINEVAEKVAGILGISVEDYADKIIPNSFANIGDNFIDHVRSQIHLRENYGRFEKFQEILNNARNGTKLPLGIPLAEKAKEKEIPAVIVTSTHHHSDEFEAVRQLVPHYYDILVEGQEGKRKNWAAGIKHLLEGEK